MWIDPRAFPTPNAENLVDTYGCDVLRTGVLDRKHAAELQHLLFLDLDYCTASYPCTHSPELLFRFYNAESAVDVVVCFACNGLTIRGSWESSFRAWVSLGLTRIRLLYYASRAIGERQYSNHIADWRYLPDVFDSRALRVLEDPASVQAFRVDPASVVSFDAFDSPTVAAHRRTVAVGHVFFSGRARLLAALLLEDDSYGEHDALCSPMPQYAIRFRRESQYVDMLLCFESDTAWYFSGPPTRRVSDRRVGIQGIRRPLVQFLKSSFHEDDVIDSLTE